MSAARGPEGFWFIGLGSGQRGGGAERVSGGRRVNRKCVRRGEWTQTTMIGVHAVSYRVGEIQRAGEKRGPGERDDGNTTALSPNSGFPAAWINISYSEQNVSRSGSAESSVNSHKLGKLRGFLHWHLYLAVHILPAGDGLCILLLLILLISRQ